MITNLIAKINGSAKREAARTAARKALWTLSQEEMIAAGATPLGEATAR